MRLVAAIPFIGMTGSDIAVLCSLPISRQRKNRKMQSQREEDARRHQEAVAHRWGGVLSRLIEAGYITVYGGDEARRGAIATKFSGANWMMFGGHMTGIQRKHAASMPLA